MSHLVYLNRIQDEYLSRFQEGLNWIRFGDLVSPDSKVFIKPNLTYPFYIPGVMTSPEAVEAAVLALKQYTPHLIIGDSDSGGYNRFSMDRVYRETGIIDFADDHGVKVVNLSTEESETISIDVNGKEVSLSLPRLITQEIDLLVTMPVPKVHMNTVVSLSFKNQWGCIPENSDRLKLHPYLHLILPELNELLRAKVTIMDGRFGLTHSGPLRGDPIRLDWVLVSNSIGSAARTACDLMQIPIETVPHLVEALKAGKIPSRDEIDFNTDPSLFTLDKFVLKRAWTDIPGQLAFRYPFFSWLGYFSPFAGFLHRLLYLFREPFYDYDEFKID